MIGYKKEINLILFIFLIKQNFSNRVKMAVKMAIILIEVRDIIGRERDLARGEVKI